MSKYTAEHADALADVMDAGDAVTFTRTVAGTYVEATDVETGASSLRLPGQAIEVDGDRDTYRALGLTHVNALALLFVPTTIGNMPEAGDTAVWGGNTVTVKDRVPLAVDGEGILATVYCARG